MEMLWVLLLIDNLFLFNKHNLFWRPLAAHGSTYPWKDLRFCQPGFQPSLWDWWVTSVDVSAESHGTWAPVAKGEEQHWPAPKRSVIHINSLMPIMLWECTCETLSLWVMLVFKLKIFFSQRGEAERLFKEIVNRRLWFVLNSWLTLIRMSYAVGKRSSSPKGNYFYFRAGSLLFLLLPLGEKKERKS